MKLNDLHLVCEAASGHLLDGLVPRAPERPWSGFLYPVDRRGRRDEQVVERRPRWRPLPAFIARRAPMVSIPAGRPHRRHAAGWPSCRWLTTRRRCRHGGRRHQAAARNTTSTPMSLHSAVTTDVSLASPKAGSGWVSPRGRRNRAGRCCASVALPPLPKANSRPPAANRAADPSRRTWPAGLVRRATTRRSWSILSTSGDGGRADLVDHGRQVTEPRAAGTGRATPWRRSPGHLPTTAIASPAWTSIGHATVTPPRPR